MTIWASYTWVWLWQKMMQEGTNNSCCRRSKKLSDCEEVQQSWRSSAPCSKEQGNKDLICTRGIGIVGLLTCPKILQVHRPGLRIANCNVALPAPTANWSTERLTACCSICWSATSYYLTITPPSATFWKLYLPEELSPSARTSIRQNLTSIY